MLREPAAVQALLPDDAGRVAAHVVNVQAELMAQAMGHEVEHEASKNRSQKQDSHSE